MIRSVLTSLQWSTATRPRCVTNGSIGGSSSLGLGLGLAEHLADVDEVARDGGGGGHGGADEVGPAAGPLTPLEVAVARAGRALAGGELVGVHRQAHAAARLTPLDAGRGEDLVEPLGLGLVADRLAPGDHQGADAFGHLAALEH